MRRGHLAIAAGQVAISGLGGCSTSPALNLFGSFFPAWMLCTAVGVAGTVILHQVLSALSINQYLIAPPLTYFCMAVAGTLLVWLLWFGH
jgi:YtcA family